MRHFVIGDIHGNFKALKQVLERSKFDYDTDRLICLGDYVDRFPESYEVIEELLKIKNIVALRGNHDQWMIDYFNTGKHGSGWTQGAGSTLLSYANSCKGFPETHVNFFKNTLLYFIHDNCLFVHGGINRHFPISDTIYNSHRVLMWDRDFWSSALFYGRMGILNKNIQGKFRIHDDFKEVFIGHTSTILWDTTEPMNAANVWNLDTGCGYNGKLTIMDINTKEYWQSDLVETLYTHDEMYKDYA